MGWTIKKSNAEEKVDVRLSLPGNLHSSYKEIAEESAVELAEVLRQALAYSLKRYNAGKKKVATETSEG